MEINLPDYKKIASQIKKNKVQVREEEIKEALSWIQRSRAKFSLKSSPCQKEDWVEIEYSSPQIEKGEKRIDSFLLGKGGFLPGFEENLEGMKEGQEREFSLFFPKNHFQKDLAGKKVDFKVKMKAVKKIELPEVDDQFAKGLGDFKNLAALEKSLREGIYLEKEMAESQRAREEILKKIVENSQMGEIPEFLVEELKKSMLENLKKEVSQKLKISFEEYLAKIGKTEGELLDSFFPVAEEKLKTLLVLREIARKENIEVENEEVIREVNKRIKNLDREKLKTLDLEKLKLYTKEVLRNEKTLQFLESFVQKI